VKFYDALSLCEVEEGDMQEIIKIDCVGFVKIVLFYVLTSSGAYQVDECYVDGLRVRLGSMQTTYDGWPEKA